jgi:uncharacterized membrane protein
VKNLVTLSMLLWAATANAVSYNIAVLNSFGGDSSAYGMNDNGQVVGNAYNSGTGQTEAVIWDTGVVTSLGFEGIARAINNSGTVVGENGAKAVNNTTGDGRAYRWDGTNGYLDLGDLNGAYAGAWDINDSGVITGNSFFNDQTAFGLLKMHAFRWENENDGMTDLVPPNPTDGYSRGIGINNNGTIIGRASVDTFTGSDKYMAQWDSSNTFTHDDPPGNYSSGRDINNSEVAVGIARTGIGTPNQAAMWDANGSVTIFGTFGGERSRLTAINDSGIAVGMAEALDGLDAAMITYDGETILDLNTLVDLTGTGLVSLDEAFDINANGDIVGVGTLSDGTRTAFVLTAVPVPAAVWLFASALGALGWLRRKPRV